MTTECSCSESTPHAAMQVTLTPLCLPRRATRVTLTFLTRLHAKLHLQSQIIRVYGRVRLDLSDLSVHVSASQRSAVRPCQEPLYGFCSLSSL